MQLRLKRSVPWTALLLFATQLVARPAEEGAETGFPGEATFKWINFAIVFTAIVYLTWKYAPPFFSSRAAAIRRELEEANRSFEESRKRLDEIERHLAELDRELDQLNREALQEQAAERERIRAAARTDAEKILAAARAEIEATTRAAKAEMKAYAARLAVARAGEQIRERMTPERQATTVERFVRSLEARSRS